MPSLTLVANLNPLSLLSPSISQNNRSPLKTLTPYTNLNCTTTEAKQSTETRKELTQAPLFPEGPFGSALAHSSANPPMQDTGSSQWNIRLKAPDHKNHWPRAFTRQGTRNCPPQNRVPSQPDLAHQHALGSLANPVPIHTYATACPPTQLFPSPAHNNRPTKPNKENRRDPLPHFTAQATGAESRHRPEPHNSTMGT